MADHSKLLPFYAAEHERRVASVGYDEDAIGEAIAKLRTMTLPLECPIAELPYLAWEESVDVWDDDWPEAIKRQAIDAAEQIHLLKGTPAAIKAALAALGLTAHITEWWQTEPAGEPGTFSVAVYADEVLYPTSDGPLIDARTIMIADKAIHRSKPLTRHYTFDVGLSLEQSLGFAGLAVLGDVLDVVGIIETDIVGNAAAGFAGVAMLGDVLDVTGVLQ